MALIITGRVVAFIVVNINHCCAYYKNEKVS